MPHERLRHASPLLSKTLRYSGIVGLFGHRQVGKTTLISHFGSNYVTLDDPLLQALAQKDGAHFLTERAAPSPLLIDECQMAPAVFPALKEWVRLHPEPGQFLLTGSVRFSSRRAIRESLTGRIIAWELLPMDLSEAAECKLPDAIPQLLRSKTLDVSLRAPSYATASGFARALSHGGLPGIFALRSEALRSQRFESMIQTLLERDLRLIIETTVGYPSLRNLLSLLALHQTQPIVLTELSRLARISLPTLRKLIHALEAIYVIRVVNTEGTERRPVLFFEDQGEASYLANDRYDTATQLLRFLYSQLRHQVHYRPELRCEIFQFRNRGGAHVPLCFRAGRTVLGIIPILSANPDPSSLSTARAFLKAYPDSRLLYVHSSSEDRMIESRIRSLGWRYLV